MQTCYLVGSQRHHHGLCEPPQLRYASQQLLYLGKIRNSSEVEQAGRSTGDLGSGDLGSRMG